MLILMKHKSTQIVFFSLPHRYYNAFMRLDDKKCKMAAVVLHWSKKEEKLQKDLNNNSPHLGYRLHSK